MIEKVYFVAVELNPTMVGTFLFSPEVSQKSWELLEFIDWNARPDKPLFSGALQPSICTFRCCSFSNVFVSGHGPVFSEKLDLKMVSRLLQKAAEMYAVRQNTATPNRPIKVEVDILQSMLQVVEAVAKPEFVGQITDTELGADTMFKVTFNFAKYNFFIFLWAPSVQFSNAIEGSNSSNTHGRH